MSFQVTSNRLISLLLAISQLGSGIVLLALSSWFIAACALAGHAGVLAGFNYVIPATVIRFLAVVRIFSSYFEKYFGHISLLAELSEIRYRLMQSTFQNRNDINAAETAALLQEDSERVAGRWSAIHNPAAGALASMAGISFIFSLLMPALLISWALLLVTLCLVAAIFGWLNLRAHRSVLSAYDDYYQQQHQWLSVSTLWHLRDDWLSGNAVKAAAERLFNARQRQHQLMQLNETLIIAIGFGWPLWIIANLFADVPPSAVWAIPLVLSASVRDWFMPIVAAVDQQTKLKPSAERVKSQSDSAEEQFDSQQARSNQPILASGTGSLQLKGFSWQRGQVNGSPLTFQFNAPGCYLITASSGSGKSSLFNALAGELEFSGSAWLNAAPLERIPQRQRAEHIFYAQQFAHVFSDTLKQNLIMASNQGNDLTDTQLIEALEWAELADWANAQQLKSWLGSEGKPISGGEKKRLSLARAYLSDRQIWLLDEPFEGLDSQLAERLALKLMQIAQHKTLIIASHIQPKSLSCAQVLSL